MDTPAQQSFVHLHCHTHYSLLDGANRIPDLINAAKQMNMPAIAITDHGNMFGVIEFYQTAKKAGVKPILGMEAYIAPGDRRDREAKGGISEASFHLLLLAQNLAGYRNLVKLSSIAFLEGFYYRPRIDRAVLEAHSEGLICTSTCLGAEIPQALLKKDSRAAAEVADWYLSIFGPERFFIELQDHGIPEQRMINPELVDIARRRGIGLVATNDVHYLTAGDHEAHNALCCISTGKLVTDDTRLKYSDQMYLKSADEMRDCFSGFPEAIANTVAIAGRCDLDLDFTKRHTPVYRPPKQQSADSYLKEMVFKGATERYGEITDEIRQRIDYELEVIQSKGFSSYFLIVWDFVQFARSRGIPAGARGSGCSAVVAYCLYLSLPDPLRYGLYFERFMDPDRDEMPDIDIDICQEGREEVLRYVRDKYGHVAQIITFGTLKPKAAIRDVSRVLGVPLSKADQIAKLVPEALKMTIDKALASEPELKRMADEDEQVRKVIDISRRLEGMARHAGVHAAGVVVADQPLDDLLPLYKPTGTDQIITQFEGGTVEKVGLLKIDFLGLRTLTVLERARQLAERNHGVTIDLDRLDLSDQKVYTIFSRGETKGIFQFESGGMKDVVMRMRPNRIEDLIAANALYRPGPMVNIDAYIARKHGEAWKTPHPIMSEVLEETYGIIVYQEQVARLAIRLGNIERKRAFRLAKAISKKKMDMIEAEREPFLAGAEKNKLRRQVANEIFDQILPFGEYAFNKAHSTGYALIAFQTAYMKAYYQLEFMAALLTFEMGDTDKVVEYIEECRRMGIEVRPPDVNSSDADFTVVRDSANANRAGGFLRFGLAAIKGVGEKAVEAIITARESGGPFASLFDFCERVDLSTVNRGVVEALIKAGSFDTTGAMRKALVESLDAALRNGGDTQRDKKSGQMALFGAPPTDKAAKNTISTSEWTEAEMLAYEKAVLGFYVTKHPLTQHAQTLRKFAMADCADLGLLGEGTDVILGGMISRIRYTVTKQGRNAGAKLAILTFEDLTGSIEAVVYSEVLERTRDLIAPDKLVFIRGSVNRTREEPSLRVTEVTPLEDAARRLSSGILLRLASVGINRAALDQLRELCKAHRGDRPIYIEVSTPDGLIVTLRADDLLGVIPDSEFVRKAEEIVGPGRAIILGGRRLINRPAPPPTEVAEESEETQEEPVAA